MLFSGEIVKLAKKSKSTLEKQAEKAHMLFQNLQSHINRYAKEHNDRGLSLSFCSSDYISS